MKFKNKYAINTKVKNKQIYSIVDIETTGGYKNGNRITEIAIINFDGTEIIDSYSSLINPEIRIPPMITRLTGIDNNLVLNAPKFYEVAKKIIEMTEGNIFMAHNVFFDFNFLKYEFGELGFLFKRDKLCTVRLARKYVPGHKSYSLGRICEELKIEIKQRHRARGDALATLELFKIILKKKPDLMSELLRSQKSLLPIGLRQINLDELPEKTGLYYFYDRQGKLLYIGKSKNIKKRVASHFRINMKRRKDIELKSAIHKVDYKLTGNELAALLIESQEIKELVPIFNIALKSKKTNISVVLCKKNKVHELKKTSVRTDVLPFYKFKNKKNADQFIASIYKSFLNATPGELDFEKLKGSFISKLGENTFNQFLEKTYRMIIPKKENFQLSFPGRSIHEKCLIEVTNYFPYKIIYLNNEEIVFEERLDEYSDTQRILFRYICK